jgi:two-component system, sensor histidine kinase LadS
VFHTLVENGLTHGYAGKDAGAFLLSRNEDESRVYFILHNDGVAGKSSAESSGLGLKYVRARLEEAYGRKWRLDSHSVEGGWEVTIAIEKDIQKEMGLGRLESGAVRQSSPGSLA